MKRTLSLLLTVIMLLSPATTCVYAEEGPHTTEGAQTGIPAGDAGEDGRTTGATTADAITLTQEHTTLFIGARNFIAEGSEPNPALGTEQVCSFGTYWYRDNDQYEAGDYILRSRGKDTTGSPAEISLIIPESGVYYFYARSLDFYNNAPGSRAFQLDIAGAGGISASQVFGKHAKITDPDYDGVREYVWKWESMGSFQLNQGLLEIKMTALAGYSRCGGFIVTTNPDFGAFPTDAGSYSVAYAQYKPTFATPPVAGDRVDVEIGSTTLTEAAYLSESGNIMVPVIEVLELLSFTTSFDNENGILNAVRNGVAHIVSDGHDTALVGAQTVLMAEKAVLSEDVLYVSSDFFNSIYETSAGYNGVKLIIDSKEYRQSILVEAANFDELGTWTLNTTYLQGTATASEPGGASGEGTVNATVTVALKESGTYKIWARARDYASNYPGSRYFNVAVDGAMNSTRLGAHGKEGFFWTLVGEYELAEGIHELALCDTSGFYARCEGLFVTADLELDLSDYSMEETRKIAAAADFTQFLPPAVFPGWALAGYESEKTESISDGSTRITFFKGRTSGKDLVQSQIEVKKSDDQWAVVKSRDEGFGFLLMSAQDTEFAGDGADQTVIFRQKLMINDSLERVVTDNFFKTGIPLWLLPSDFTVENNKATLYFGANDTLDLTVTVEYDTLSPDPKVTLDALFKKPGAYSFLLSNGAGTDETGFDAVTAPLLYVKKNVPAQATIVPECYLFTPMATLHFEEGNANGISGSELTSGLVMDPGSVGNDYTYPDTSSFGLILRDYNGRVNPQFCAPLFGNAGSQFDENEAYTVSYRLIHRTEAWADTLKSVATDLYNFSDIRTNYYSSLNEAIYNATDLMMDDAYGGWDAGDMAPYNMEKRDLVTQANMMAILQRALLSDNEEIFEKRAIPTLAYTLSRLSYHFKKNDTKGGATGYTTVDPAPIGGPVTQYGTSVYGGLYEMTQGRMPFLLYTGLNTAIESNNFRGVTDSIAMLKYTGDESYKESIIKQADIYLINHPAAEKNQGSRFESGFIYGDYIPMVNTFVAAYEATGDSKYLDAAVSSADYLATGIWTTGYHEDYVNEAYTVTEAVGERPLVADRFTFWWHGDEQWRLGNVDGEAKSPQELGQSLVEETVPGWLTAKAGLGTEHPRTPGHGNIITMNNWAGTLMKLSYYSGDDFYETMARNTMIGRFSNYPGYYQDRRIVHQMQADYPYEGPDYTSIYWHHIPVFIAQLEDFLINSAYVKSNGNIQFPSLYQSGYAYFISNQFGHEPGSFYSEEGMWLWLDRGIVEIDSQQIDYVAARKAGVFGISLMNEDNESRTVTVRLGEKIPDASNINTAASVFDENGNAASINVVNGEFSVTLPSKGMRSLIIQIDGMEAPSYASTFEYSNNLENTVTSHTRGKGHVVQMTADAYYAYTYISDMADTAEKLTIYYAVGDKVYTEEKTAYSFEFLIKVEDPEEAFVYSLTVTKKDGSEEELGGGVLRPYSFENDTLNLGEEEVSYDPSLAGMEPVDLNIKMIGSNASSLRIVVAQSDLPEFLLVPGITLGLKIEGTATLKNGGGVKVLDNYVRGYEIRTAQNDVVFSIPIAGHLSSELPYNAADYTFEAVLYAPRLTQIKPVSLKIDAMPEKTSCTAGESVDYNGLRVSLRLNNNTSLVLLPEDLAFTVPQGEILNTGGVIPVGISYTYNGSTVTAAFNLLVQPGQPVSQPLFIRLNGSKSLHYTVSLDSLYEDAGSKLIRGDTQQELAYAYIHYSIGGNFVGKVEKVDLSRAGTYKIVYKYTDENGVKAYDESDLRHAYIIRVVTVNAQD